MKLQIAALALALVSTVATAEVKVNCTYTTGAKSVGFEVPNPGSSVTVSLLSQNGDFEYGYVNAPASNLTQYSQALVDGLKTSGSGTVYAVSRNDKAQGNNVKVDALIGTVQDGKLVNPQTVIWNFGLTDGSMVIQGKQSLGNLSCEASKK